MDYTEVSTASSAKSATIDPSVSNNATVIFQGSSRVSTHTLNIEASEPGGITAMDTTSVSLTVIDSTIIIKEPDPIIQDWKTIIEQAIEDPTIQAFVGLGLLVLLTFGLIIRNARGKKKDARAREERSRKFCFAEQCEKSECN